MAESAEIRITGLKWSYLVGIAILIGFAGYIFSAFPLKADELMPEGTWLVLGGFSLSLPLGVFPLLIAAWMLVRVAITAKSLSFSKLGDDITIHERHFLGKSTKFVTCSPKIDTVRLISGPGGRRLWWVLPWGIHAAFVLTDGIFLLSNPLTFGGGVANGFAFLLSGILDLIVLGLIVFPPEAQFSLETAEELVQVDWSPVGQNKQILQKISEFFGLEQYRPSKTLSVSHEKLFFLGVALICIGVAVITRFTNFGFGAPVRLPLFLLGIALVPYGLLGLPLLRKGVKGLPYFRPDGFTLFVWLAGLLSVLIGLSLGSWLRFALVGSLFWGTGVFLFLVGPGIVLLSAFALQFLGWSEQASWYFRPYFWLFANFFFGLLLAFLL
jgi:hypothetical protein